MQQPRYFLLLLALFAGQFLAAQCLPTETKVRVEIDPDEFFENVYWVVGNLETEEIFADGFFQNDELVISEFCVPNDQCLVFYLYDDDGDGFTEGGSYRLFLADTLYYENPTGDFPGLDITRFGCPPGSFCDNPFTATLGHNETPGDRETWYRFVPQDTGTYKITTCGLGNNCLTKIWVYDFCKNLFVTDNQAGSVAYADGGCADGSQTNLFLAGGKEYYIRVRFRYPDCVGVPLKFDLTYLGPVKGCTDPAACNYSPLATVSDTCIYEGPACLRLPDLETDEDLIRSTLTLSDMTNGDLCLIEEGCIRGFGKRYLLEFSTRISNVGDEDYYIGNTPAQPTDTSSQFVWDPCHNHWHYRGYADYVLYDQSGKRVPIGSKTGFCVLDLECNNGDFGKYTCENMGITAGCGDVYDIGLPCQWIDITDLAAGTYTFVVRVNWEQKPDKNGRLEKNYENNWAQVCFNLTYDGGLPDVQIVNTCEKYLDCTGVLFGNAQPDCEGICQGPALRGDWNKDAARDAADTKAYLDAALADNGTPTECKDLHANGAIDVYDAALLQECALHANDVTYWGSRFPCNFPGGLDNPGDQVYLRAGALDTAAKTWTLRILNPNQRVIGYEFNVTGLEIDTVFNVMSGATMDVRHDATGEILALAATEQASIKKNSTPTDFLRIKYKKLTAPELCISEITAVVNTKYQKSNAKIGPPACTSTGLVGTGEPEAAPFGIHVQPNPFDRELEIFFENPDNEAVTAVLSDLTGRVLRQIPGIRADNFRIERGNLASGIYLLTLRGERGSATVKVAVD